MAENIRKAYELREKVSERERFYIEANYYWTERESWRKAVPAYELWQQTYPRDYALYVHLGSFTRALETWKRHWRKTARGAAPGAKRLWTTTPPSAAAT